MKTNILKPKVMKTQLLPAIRNHSAAMLLLCAFCLAATFTAHAPPTVSGVSAYQVTNTMNVTIGYAICETNSTITNVNVFFLVSQDAGATWTVPATSVLAGVGTLGVGVPVTSNFQANWFTWTRAWIGPTNIPPIAACASLPATMAWCLFPPEVT